MGSKCPSKAKNITKNHYKSISCVRGFTCTYTVGKDLGESIRVLVSHFLGLCHRRVYTSRLGDIIAPDLFKTPVTHSGICSGNVDKHPMLH